MGKHSRKKRKLLQAPHDPKLLADVMEGRLVLVTREKALIGLIDSAIELLVAEKDVSSIHVLIMAAWKVLRDLGGDELGPELHKDPRIKDWITDGYDFFRHASPDLKDLELTMPALLNEIVIFDVTESFLKQFAKLTPLMKTFRAWFIIDYRDYAKPFENLLKETIPPDIIAEAATWTRRKFFDAILPTLGVHSGEPPECEKP